MRSLGSFRFGHIHDPQHGPFRMMELYFAGRHIAHVKLAVRGGGLAGSLPKGFRRITGFAALLLAIFGSLYYVIKRKLAERMRNAQKAQRSRYVALIKRAFRWHYLVSYAALTIALIHVWPTWPHVKLSTGWIALGMRNSSTSRTPCNLLAYDSSIRRS